MANNEHLERLRQGARAWNSWRASKPEVVPDLEHAQLLRHWLEGVDLRNANLVHADLTGAELVGANLCNADLRCAKLRGANLVDANFSGADLNNVEISVALLGGANFAGSKFGFTTIARTDISVARGLGEVCHDWPSNLSTDVLEITSNSIVRRKEYEKSTEIAKFLKGAGVAESLVTQFMTWIDAPSSYYSAFISHSHHDKEFARWLYSKLNERGVHCWLDEHAILPGEDIYEKIDEGIRFWDKVLLCCSEKSLTSWWVDDEIMKAIQKEQSLKKERDRAILAIIPLDLDGFLMTEQYRSGYKSTLTRRLVADFRTWKAGQQRAEANLESLLKALHVDSTSRKVPISKL